MLNQDQAKTMMEAEKFVQALPFIMRLFTPSPMNPSPVAGMKMGGGQQVLKNAAPKRLRASGTIPVTGEGGAKGAVDAAKLAEAEQAAKSVRASLKPLEGTTPVERLKFAGIDPSPDNMNVLRGMPVSAAAELVARQHGVNLKDVLGENLLKSLSKSKATGDEEISGILAYIRHAINTAKEAKVTAKEDLAKMVQEVPEGWKQGMQALPDVAPGSLEERIAQMIQTKMSFPKIQQAIPGVTSDKYFEIFNALDKLGD